MEKHVLELRRYYGSRQFKILGIRIRICNPVGRKCEGNIVHYTIFAISSWALNSQEREVLSNQNKEQNIM